MAMRILIAEDEESLTLLLRYNLEAEGYEVEVVARGDEAELRLREEIPDLVLLDWMLPGLSGIELCRRIRLRRETERLPVIILTARGEESDRVRGLATGADDYVTKPFSVPELLARVRALLRRAKPGQVANLLAAGDIELDRETHRVRRGGKEVHLGPTEFKLLEFLMAPAASSRASSSSTACGAATSISTSAPSMYMSGVSVRRSTAHAAPTRSAPFEAPATHSTKHSPSPLDNIF
jgi:two-component system phosphate regulon response regulator PhoB